MGSLTLDRSTAGKRKADDSFDIEGMVVRLLKPIVTSRPALRTNISCTHEQQKNDFLQDIVEVTAENQLLPEGDRNDCETPKSEEHKIPNVLECPPAPRKPRQKPRMNMTSSPPQGFFFSPPDLDSAFTVYRKSPPRKKMRWSKRISALAI